MMKTKNYMKTLATMLILTVATTMSASAATHARSHNDRSMNVAATSSPKRVSHFEPRHAYRPQVMSCSFRLSRHDMRNHTVERAQGLRGVLDVRVNFRTRRMTVVYDANMISARQIRRVVK